MTMQDRLDKIVSYVEHTDYMILKLKIIQKGLSKFIKETHPKKTHNGGMTENYVFEDGHLGFACGKEFPDDGVIYYKRSKDIQVSIPGKAKELGNEIRGNDRAEMTMDELTHIAVNIDPFVISLIEDYIKVVTVDFERCITFLKESAVADMI